MPGVLKKFLKVVFISATVIVVMVTALWMSGYGFFSEDSDRNGSIQTVKSASVQDVKENCVIPGGQSIGVKLDVEDVLVVGLEEIETEEGEKINPGLKAGLQIGDIIIAIDGIEVHSADDVKSIIENTDKNKVNLKIGRKDELIYIDIIPVRSADDGLYKLGLWVKEKTAGIGTLTFYSPTDGTFAALGHGITDVETGSVLKVSEGQLLDARILSLKEGKKGSPGELRGIFYEADEPLGRLVSNTQNGIFGIAYKQLVNNRFAQPVEVAESSEVEKGPAYIYTTLSNDKVEKFDIEIEKISNDDDSNKNMIIHVTDDSLLSASGGIIQGMSGSPIIQNDKLVGAVTHVLVNNPERGYGIFAETMLKESRAILDN
ncbi:MAG: SpoIVB peptidase [Firmicutes bacterium]|nr:SpoIVB peptidase [Bacillota bacterium]